MTSDFNETMIAEMSQAIAAAVADLDVLQREAEADRRAGRTKALLAEHWAWRASIFKRQAEVEFLSGRPRQIWRKPLAVALNDYSQGLQQGVGVDHWVLGQYCVLETVLSQAPYQQRRNRGSERPKTGHPHATNDRSDIWWNQACQATLIGIENDPNAIGRMWARSSMVDLLMVSLMGRGPVPKYGVVRPQTVVEELDRMVDDGGGPSQCVAIWPTFRQFWRWHRWWLPADKDAAAKAREGARRGYEYLYDLVRPRLGNWVEPDASASKETS